MPPKEANASLSPVLMIGVVPMVARPPPLHSNYNTLLVPFDATQKEVKKQELLPCNERSPSNTTQTATPATSWLESKRRFQAVQEAYDVIGDAAKRKQAVRPLFRHSTVRQPPIATRGPSSDGGGGQSSAQVQRHRRRRGLRQEATTARRRRDARHSPRTCRERAAAPMPRRGHATVRSGVMRQLLPPPPTRRRRRRRRQRSVAALRRAGATRRGQRGRSRRGPHGRLRRGTASVESASELAWRIGCWERVR